MLVSFPIISAASPSAAHPKIMELCNHIAQVSAHHARAENGYIKCPHLLNATGGALKPEKCFWYLIDYICKEGEWKYAEMVPREMVITNPDGTKSPIKQE
jgi:hypothetical protein